MSNYNFKVEVQIKEDLSDIEREEAIKYVAKWQDKFELIKLDEETYCKGGEIKEHEDFGAVTFFFSVLKRKREYFSKLVYYDLWEGSKHFGI